MNIDKIKKVYVILSFLSISLGWFLTNLVYSIYLGLAHGKASDSGVILFYSGIFTLISWAVFIIYPLSRLDPSKRLFKPYIFPFATIAYACLTYSILVGGLFQSLELIWMFIPLAILEGLFFGIAYSKFIRNNNFASLLNDNLLIKIGAIFSPVIYMIIWLWLLPRLTPILVFRYVPDEIREGIFVRNISKFKKGDSFEKFRHAFPGMFDDWRDGSGGGGSGPLIDYNINVKNDTITKLEYTIKK